MRNKKIDLANEANKRCERCQYYTRYSKSKLKGANPFGFCVMHDAQFKYWDVCKKFIWNDKYLGIKFGFAEKSPNGQYLCKRCRRPLHDPESIARGFGKDCYEKHIKELIRQSKRLF